MCLLKNYFKTLLLYYKLETNYSYYTDISKIYNTAERSKQQKQLQVCQQSACRVVTSTLTIGEVPTPLGLLIGRPFWLSLCLLFSKVLFTVPP